MLTEEGHPVTLDSPYMPNRRLFYYREVKEEPLVPFDEQILFKNSHLLVACKPHFLPVIPAGQYLHETLIKRLKEKTGNPFLSPINRIDRGTAGLVLISVKKDTRGLYQQLFMNGLVRKTYEAIAYFPYDSLQKEWLVEDRLEQGHPWFRMRSCAGEINARSRIHLVEAEDREPAFNFSP